MTLGMLGYWVDITNTQSSPSLSGQPFLSLQHCMNWGHFRAMGHACRLRDAFLGEPRPPWVQETEGVGVVAAGCYEPPTVQAQWHSPGTLSLGSGLIPSLTRVVMGSLRPQVPHQWDPNNSPCAGLGELT